MALSDLVAPDLLAGRTAFVSGGGSGLNLAIARALAEVGAKVAICGRTEEKLVAAAEELRAIGGEVHHAVADVRDLEAMEAALAGTREALGPVDVVVAGAAGNFLAPIGELSSNAFRTVVDIDLQGTFHTARAAYAQLRETRGCFLAITADQSTAPYLLQGHVGAAKAGVESLVRSLALEWGPHGVRCNTIAPGPVEGTEGMERLTEQVGREAWESTTALGRFARPEEVAAMAVVLCSPLAAYVSGARVDVDGGTAIIGPGRFNAALAASLTDGD